MSSHPRRGTLCVLLGFLFSCTALGQVPRTISYQGVLADESGVPVPDGEYDLQFGLYDAAVAGTALWTEVLSVGVAGGQFNAILGSSSPLSLPFDAPYWLGITVGSDPEMSPRTALTASPYSLGSAPLPSSEFDVGLKNLSAFSGIDATAIVRIAGEDGDEDIVHVLADEAGGQIPALVGLRAKGTLDAPAAIGASEAIYGMLFNGYTGSQPALAASIWASSDGPFTETWMPGTLQFSTTGQPGLPGGSLTLTSTGNLGVRNVQPTEDIEVNGFGHAEDAYLRLNTGGGYAWKSGIKMRVYSEEFGFTIEHTDRPEPMIGLDILRHSLDEGRTPEEAQAGVSSLFIRRDNGFVGIGNRDPWHRLSVSGEIESREGGFVFPDGSVQTAAAPAEATTTLGDVSFGGISLERWGYPRGGLWFALLGDLNHALYNNIHDLDGEGAFDGMKWNVFDGLRIRSGSHGETEALRIEQDGSVGIRTESTIDLAIRDSDTGLRVPADGTLDLVGNGATRLRIAPDGRIGVGSVDVPSYPIHHENGAHLTDGGVWTDASSRGLKENIAELPTDAALEALGGLVPVTFNYRREPGEQYVGFIAEDVPHLVAMGDRTSLSPMDMVALLTKVVQSQQVVIGELQRRLDRLESTNR